MNRCLKVNENRKKNKRDRYFCDMYKSEIERTFY